MKVLILHNAYQHRGGEDTVLEQEAALLSEAGHEVQVELFTNDDIYGTFGKFRALVSVNGNSRSANRVAQVCAETAPDVVHFHNFFPLLSPSAHMAAAQSGAAVIQTLHNFRLACAGAMFLRNGEVCEDCVGTQGVAAIRHRCYRGSLVGTAAVVAMQRSTAGSKEWIGAIDRFIALTNFGRRKFVEAGLPIEKVVVKPNFVSGIEAGPIMSERSNGALFVGRLSPEKGLRHLLKAWRKLPDVPLTIIGRGPEEEWLRANAPAHVTVAGGLSREGVIGRMQMAKLLVFPSLWYEGFPMTLAEALACGTPVLAADIGAAHEILFGQGCGALYPPGDVNALVSAVRRLITGDIGSMSRIARERYVARYSPEPNLGILERVYTAAIEAKAAKADELRAIAP